MMQQRKKQVDRFQLSRRVTNVPVGEVVKPA